MEHNNLFKEFDELIKFIILDAVKKGKHEDRKSISVRIGKNKGFVAQKYSEVKYGKRSTVSRETIDLIKEMYGIQKVPVTVSVKQATGIIANKSIENQATLSVLLDLVCEVLAHGKNIPSSAVLDSAKRMVDDRIRALTERE